MDAPKTAPLTIFHGTCVPLCAPKTTSRASMAAPRWLPSAWIALWEISSATE